jgi:hypothetical protein
MGCQLCPTFHFLRKRIMESALPYVLDYPLPDYALKCSIRVFFFWVRLCEGRFDKKLFSYKNFGISKLF